MRAAVLRSAGGPLHMEERPAPQPRGEEVLVQVRSAGVCRSDLHMLDGDVPGLPLPRVLGHEIAGEADGIGPVLVYASWGDRTCWYCRRGEEQLCPRVAEPGWARDGGYAEAVVVPSARYLLPLGGLDPVRAAPLADAGVTAYRAVRRVGPWLRDGGTVVVIGAGGLGQFAIQYLTTVRQVGRPWVPAGGWTASEAGHRATDVQTDRLLPAGVDIRVIVVDPNEAKRRRAKQLGANQAAAPDDELPEAHAVLDFVGSDDTLALAARLVRRTGIVMLVGEAGGHLPFRFGAVPHEAHLTTTVGGSLGDLRDVLDLARRGELDWKVESMPLERANEALERLRRGEVAGRLVLVP
jgi:propanol-preferring alcohol dehydrogenase